MTAAKTTIVILLASFLILCLGCFWAKPLLTGTCDDRTAEFVKSISSTAAGESIAQHYLNHLARRVLTGFKPYRDLVTETPTSNKALFIVAGFMFAGLVALFSTVVSAALFYINRDDRQKTDSKLIVLGIVLLVILNGTVIRLILASVCYGNLDMEAYELAAGIFRSGGNIYAETNRYNYSPVWFFIIGFLKHIQLQFPAIPFHFVVRAFLTGVDLVTVAFLLLIAAHQGASLIKTAIFFYLNPVSFAITGFHGQFENLAILFVVIGVFLFLKLKDKPVWGNALIWIFATLGLIIKHNIFYQLIICLHYAIKRYWLKLALFAVSVCVFLAMFVPYWDAGKKNIIDSVFNYSSGTGRYGVTSIYDFPSLRYVFILGMLIFPLLMKSDDIVHRCLLGMLFFVTFTTGVATQYFVLPVAFGALRPSKGFMAYSLAASLFILGDYDNVFIPGLHLFNWNVVWLGALYWFFTAIREDTQAPKAVVEVVEVEQPPAA